MVAAEPYARLVRHLAGESEINDLARVAGLDRKTIRHLRDGRKAWIQQRTAERVRRLIDLLPPGV